MALNRRKAFSLLAAALLVAVALWMLFGSRGGGSCECPEAPKLGFDKYDLFGGVKSLCDFERRGVFYLAERGGRWWLVDPLGCAFISKGVNHINPYGDYSPALGYSPYERNVRLKYGGFGGWIEAAVTRMRSWGFNTVGSWSYSELFYSMPYTVILNIASEYGFDWVTGKVPDIFEERFEQVARGIAERECAPRASDPLLIGYFLDNELRWGPDWRSPNHLLDDFVKLPPSSPGKKVAAEAITEAAGGDFEKLSSQLGVTVRSVEDLLSYSGGLPPGGFFDRARGIFLRRFAERYFSVAVSAVKASDPNHLVLGIRFAGLPPREVLEVAGRYVDVVTVNIYSHDPPVDAVRQVYEVTGKPVMITEFSFKAMDSGLPNTRGAGQPVQTQRERAYLAAKYVLKVVELPYVVGYHWFQYSDQPREGRFDGENSNFGLVTISDEPWSLLVEVFTMVNSRAEEVHDGKLKADDVLNLVVELVKAG